MTRSEIAETLSTVNAAQHEGFIKFADLVMNEPVDLARGPQLVRVMWTYFAAGWSRDTEIDQYVETSTSELEARVAELEAKCATLI